MVVGQFNIKNVGFFKTKNNPPVRPDRDRPMALEVSLQGMKAKRRLVEVVDRASRLEGGENAADFLDHVRSDLAAIILLEEA